LGAAAAPVVDGLVASPATVAPGETVTLIVNAHDPDCPATCTSGCGLYIRADLTRWEADGGTFIAEDDGTSGSPYTATADWQAPAVEATYTLTVFLSDSGSFFCGGRQSTSASVTVLVTSSTNQPPVISSLTATPVQIFPGGTSVLACAATDPDGDPVTYSWSADAGTVTPTGDGGAEFTADEPAIATVTCTAIDPAGAFSEETVAVSITGAVAEKALTEALVNPQRLAVDSTGDVYVADRRGGGITVLHLESGALVKRLLVPGVASVAVDWADRLLVADAAGARVLSTSGGLLLVLDPGQALGLISDVAVDQANRRYGVLYRTSGRVVVYDEIGTVVADFGSTGDGPGQFMSPQGLAATPAGDWVVADTGHGLVKVFDLAGTLIGSFGGLGGGAGEFVQLDDVAVDVVGLIYTSDRFQDWVQVWNPDGSLREVLGTYGGGVGEFKTATGVEPAGTLGKLLAASLNTSSIQVFSTPVVAVELLSFGIE
jgi:sugar lactone lactonase YvrE